MLKFLDGAAAADEIRRLVGSSAKVHMAVAFWGKGAAEEFGLKAKGGTPQVICNLKTGGTNPDEIETLIRNGVGVKQCDTLHGKLYLFDDCVIIGSSNASTNGLALEGSELSGWQEANLLTDDSEVYKEAAKWLELIPSQEVSKEDLQSAKDAFSRRRHAIVETGIKAETLIEALKKYSDRFTNKRFYLCAYRELLDRQQEAKIKKEAKTQGDSGVSGFGWEIPEDANLICFFVGPKGGVTFDHFWQRPEYKWEENGGEHPVWFAKKQPTLDGYRSIGTFVEWRGAVNQFVQDVEKVGGPWHIDLGIFYSKYLDKRAGARRGELRPARTRDSRPAQPPS